jgi:hypothetical protein
LIEKHYGPRLRDIVGSEPGDIEIIDEIRFMVRLPQEGPQKPAFQEAVCNANAVLIGTIVPSARKELAHSQAKDTASYLSLVRTFAKGECKN